MPDDRDPAKAERSDYAIARHNNKMLELVTSQRMKEVDRWMEFIGGDPWGPGEVRAFFCKLTDVVRDNTRRIAELEAKSNG